MSEDILNRHTQLLILAESARAIGDFEEYRKLKDRAFELRLSYSLNLH